MSNAEFEQRNFFGLGTPLPEMYARYFTGQAHLNPLTRAVNIANVTFEPGCRNNWHIHHRGGQVLLVIAGRGWYQAWGESARELRPGDAVEIPPEVKHWHGAAKDSWFSHLGPWRFPRRASPTSGWKPSPKRSIIDSNEQGCESQ